MLDQLDAEEHALAARLVRESVVLLENDGVLPLPADGGQIAVIGPIADSARDIMGDYAHMPHIETLAELRHQANPFGFPSSDVIQPADEVAAWPTILGALRDRFGASRVAFARGTGIREGNGRRRSRRPSSWPRSSEVAIVTVGERSGPHVRRHDRRVARPPGPRRCSAASRSCSRRSSRPGRRRSCSS